MATRMSRQQEGSKPQSAKPNIPRPKRASQDRGPLSQCPFVPDEKINSNTCHEFTVNQLIEMQKWYERNPSGLLILNSTDEQQQ